jgi:hypothetical protein
MNKQKGNMTMKMKMKKINEKREMKKIKWNGRKKGGKKSGEKGIRNHSSDDWIDLNKLRSRFEGKLGGVGCWGI